MLEFNQKTIDTDKQGYLLDHTQWSKQLAPIIAEQENISLSEQHWEVINFVREFYLEYNTSQSPPCLADFQISCLKSKECS